MENITLQKSIGAIAVSILLGMFLVAGVVYLQANRAIKEQAIDGCLKLVQIAQKTDTGQNVFVPEQYWYKYCMKEKGYK